MIDATTNELVQTIPLAGGNPHSVTSSEANGHVDVPVGATGGGGWHHPCLRARVVIDGRWDA